MSAAEWDELGHRNYRKREIYTVQWLDQNGNELDLRLQVVKGAPYGGPIAMIEDENKVPRTQPFFIRTFTPSGKLLAAIPWRESGRLAGLGWTNEEHLVAVLSTGTIKVFDIFGRELRSFSMGSECESATIAEASIFGSGLVVRTAGACFKLWAVLSLLDAYQEPFQLADPKLERPPVTMLAIDPHITKDTDDVQVLVASADSELLCISRYRKTVPSQKSSRIRCLRLCPNAMFLAMYDETGEITVVSRDFKKCLSRFKFPEEMLATASSDVGSDSGLFPLDMQWCGNDALVLVWPQTVIVASSTTSFAGGGHSAMKNTIEYPYTSGTDITLVPECDSLRIVTSDSYESLEMVPYATQDIFQYGSQEKAATLYDSFEDFENGDARADSHRRKIPSDEMEDAVDACLLAARTELDNVEIQRKLLGAAAYGKLFIDKDAFDRDAFVDACRSLRVLNELRKCEMSMPLTSLQFDTLTPAVVIQRLIYRRHHLFAIRIAQYMKLPFDSALQHWAVCKLETAAPSMHDSAIVEQIRAKLSVFPEFSYAKIADAAKKRSRALAIELLEFEPRATEKVRKLVEFDEFEIALGKAVESLNCDLIYMVLVRLIAKYARDESGAGYSTLFDLIEAHSGAEVHHSGDSALVSESSGMMRTSASSLRRGTTDSGGVPLLAKGLARTLFIKLCEMESQSSSARVCEMHKHLLKSYLSYRKDATALGFKYVKQAILCEDSAESIRLTEAAMGFLEKDKHLTFALRMTADYKRSLKYQKRMNLELNHALGASVAKTVRALLLRDDARAARQFAKEMDVSPKRWWHTMCATYAELGKWEGIEAEVGKMKKHPPPIGFLPIVELCVEFKQKHRARKYILQLEDVSEKLEWLCQLNFWDDAVDVALGDRDMDALQTIAHVCKDTAVLRRIQDIMASS